MKSSNIRRCEGTRKTGNYSPPHCAALLLHQGDASKCAARGVMCLLR
jgi:hypothetical protein